MPNNQTCVHSIFFNSTASIPTDQPAGWVSLQVRQCDRRADGSLRPHAPRKRGRECADLTPGLCAGCWPAARRSRLSSRKEVIQPQVPLRLPCYDLVPVTEFTVGRRLPCGLAERTSGAPSSHDLTGGVYKAQEHIHRAVADARLLAIPTSWSRVADSNPNWGVFSAICSTSRSCVALCTPL